MTNKTQSEQNKSAFVLPTKQTLAIARAHPTRVNGSALVLKAAWTLAHLQSFLKHLSEETAYSAGDSDLLTRALARLPVPAGQVAVAPPTEALQAA